MKEGFRLDAYQDEGGVWTIGYGHTKNVKPGKIIKEEAFKGAADEFDTFNAKDGKVVEGLTNRRKQEKELFLTPDK